MARGPYYEPGRYWGTITSQQLGESSNGNPQFILRFEVLGKINLADPEGELVAVTQNLERTIYRAITDNSIDWILQDLEQLGFTGASFAELDPGNEVFQDFSGQEIPIRCEHDTYQGTVREKWSIGVAPSAAKPLEPKAIRQLDSMFGKALRALPKAKQAVRETGTPKSAPPPVDDVDANIPF